MVRGILLLTVSLWASLQAPPASSTTPPPPNPPPAKQEQPSREPSLTAEQLKAILARAESGTIPTDAASLTAEVKELRAAVLNLRAFAVTQSEQLAACRSDASLARAALAHLENEGFSRGRIVARITVEDGFDAGTYCVLDLDGEIHRIVVKEGGAFGWSRFHPREFLGKLEYRSVTIIDDGGHEQMISEASIDFELKDRILDRARR